MQDLPFKKLFRILQVANTDVGYRPVSEVAINPVQKVIAMARDRFCAFSRVRFYRPNKKVNEMFAPLVDQRRHRSVIEIIKTTTD